MRYISILLSALGLALAACGGARGGKPSSEAAGSPAAEPEPVQPVLYRHRVVAEYPHPADNYTQGLVYFGGLLWEGTGQWGASRLMTIDIDGSGRTETLASLPPSEFGEGIAIAADTIYQLTWTTGIAHLYDLRGRLQRSVEYSGEGWGITSDGERLFTSDGTSTLLQVDPVTFRPLRGVTVTLQGRPLENINELEWIGGRIWANVYLTTSIVMINPETGVVEGVLELDDLLGRIDIDSRTDVLNGIAYDEARDRILVTGKNWNKIFEKIGRAHV